MTVPAVPNPVRDVLASLPRQDRHKPKGGPVKKSGMSRRRAWVLIGVHVLIALHFLHWWWTGRSVTPVEPSEAMQTIEGGAVNAGFILFLVLIGSTLVFGRWFCGWACHVVALQDLCAWLLGRAGLKPRPMRSRLLVLTPWLVAGHMFLWPAIKRWFDPSLERLPSPADWHLELMTNDLWKTFPGPLMGVATFAVVGFLIVWWLGAKGFCTHGCPYGAFFVLADRFAPMRIKVTDACEGCGHCTSVCTSNVRVHEEVAKHGMIVDPGCMKCMDCVSVCPKEALYFGLARPQPFAVSRQRLQARADFTWPEEIALAGIAFGAFYAFRGAWLGESIPMLLAVAMGVITAVLLLLGWRLVRRPGVTFQHTVLKDGGRLTRGGRWAVAAIVLWGAFTVHTGLLHRAGAAAFQDALDLLREQRSTRAVEPARFQAVEQRLANVDAWSLWTPPLVLGIHGLVLRELHGRAPLAAHQDAIRQLERMVERRVLDRERLLPADHALANYYLGLGRLDDAGRLARQTLERVPNDATALEILRRVEAMK